MPNLVAYDLAGVQPMSGPTGLIFAMRSRYSSMDGTETFYDEVDTSFSGLATDAAKNTIEVGGSKVADGSGNASFVGVVTATAFDTSIGEIRGISTTVTSTSGVVILGLTTAYRSANYQIQATQGSNYNMTNINVIHDGTNTYMNEFGTLNQPTGIATFSTDINSGALRLLGYPSSSSSTTFKVIFTALQV